MDDQPFRLGDRGRYSPKDISMQMRIQLMLVLVLLAAGCTDSNPENSTDENCPTSVTTDERNPAPNSLKSENTDRHEIFAIKKGATIKESLAVLDSAGFTIEGGWQWGSSNPDGKILWRKIADGIEIAISYSEKSQLLTGVSMMYIPPKYERRGNYQVVPVDEIAFNPNGTYTVTFAKPEPLTGE